MSRARWVWLTYFNSLSRRSYSFLYFIRYRGYNTMIIWNILHKVASLAPYTQTTTRALYILLSGIKEGCYMSKKKVLEVRVKLVFCFRCTQIAGIECETGGKFSPGQSNLVKLNQSVAGWKKKRRKKKKKKKKKRTAWAWTHDTRFTVPMLYRPSHPTL